jgi:DNA-binding NtrC family response regulator
MKATSEEKPVVLIVDDERHTREGLKSALESKYAVMLADNTRSALETLESHVVDVMVTDMRMPGDDGLKLLKRATSLPQPPVCILMTAYGTFETGAEAIKLGAYDVIAKPIDLGRLELTISRALQSRSQAQQIEQLRGELEKKFGLEHIIGESPKMQEVFETVRQVAPSRATVLIQGESGTGKELIAHAVHQLSPRKNGPFVAVHCAALTPTLLESELFGHEKGAFTGAVERRIGRFEAADGGTLFLDEIAEIDPSVQVKILRVLEQRQFERVGGSKTLTVDVRLVAATNRDLAKVTAEGKFRDDLFYRLNVVTVTMPPLRERQEDVPLLIKAFHDEFSRENNKPIYDITPEAMKVLLAYSWPGNVRELRNCIERMVVLTRGNKLTVADIPSSIREATTSAPAPAIRAAVTIEEAEKQLIIQALKETKGNRTAAAAKLGISRRTLHRKLHEYNLRDV